mmetsp:Transcript_19494/g.57784  ORF Transcript_19494/g.57784 Transcript_19494/m.57784 type:complete len:167 (-) Transcript_19494:826-1326(-)
MGTSDDSSFLVALPSEHGSASPTAASKLEVGPSAISKFDFLRNAAFGPYWIVAVGAENVAVPGDEEESGDADEPGDGPAPEAEASQQLVYRWVEPLDVLCLRCADARWVRCSKVECSGVGGLWVERSGNECSAVGCSEVGALGGACFEVGCSEVGRSEVGGSSAQR